MDLKALRMGFIGIGALFVGISGLYLMSDMNSYRSSVAERQVKIDELAKRADSVGEQAEAVENVTEDDAQDTLDLAKSAADKIAALENEYMQMLYQDRSSEDAEAAFSQRQDDIWAVFDSYFGEKNILRTPWYFADKSVGDNIRWKAAANYRFSGTKVPVVWSYASDDGLYAYVSALYDSGTDSFSNPVKCVTALGNSALAMTGSDTAVEGISQNTDGIFAIIDQVNKGDMPDNRIVYTEEEQKAYSKDNEERQKALAEMKEQQRGGE